MRSGDRIRDPNIHRIYFTTFALGLAYGMAISLIAVFLNDRGFEKSAIGSLAAWFASGIVLFSLPMGALIRRFGAKRTLIASLLGYALMVLAFPFTATYAGIAAVRFVDGACSVGVWVSSETILLSRSDERSKAFVTSLYAIALSAGYVIGPLLARGLASVAPLSLGFVAAAGCAAIAAAYVALRLNSDRPSDELGSDVGGAHSAASSSVEILNRIKTACFATFAYGYFQASVVLFLPLYLMEEKGISKEQTIIVPAFFAGGMLLFSNLAGRVGDRFGHLLTMRVLGGVGLTMILGFVFLGSYPAMCVAVFAAGASLASISPVSLALQGVVTRRGEYSRATALYNAFYAAGMLAGPPISSQLFQRFGGSSMLYHLAGLWAGFVVFTLLFRRDDPKARGVAAGGLEAPELPPEPSIAESLR